MKEKNILVDVRAQAINSSTVRHKRKYVKFCIFRTEEDRGENLEIVSRFLI